MQINLDVDLSQFTPSWRLLTDHKLPKAIVKGFADTAEHARDKARDHTRKAFDLKSDYIPKAIKHLPDSGAQRAAAARSMLSQGTFKASVFVRGATQPSKDLSFLVDHAVGRDRKAKKNKAIAVPSKDLKKYSYRTTRGGVKKRWKPAELLKHYNAEKRPRGGKKRRAKYYKPFVLVSKKGRAYLARTLVRERRTEIFYAFSPKIHLNKIWFFADVVVREVNRELPKKVIQEINMVTK